MIKSPTAAPGSAPPVKVILTGSVPLTNVLPTTNLNDINHDVVVKLPLLTIVVVSLKKLDNIVAFENVKVGALQAAEDPKAVYTT